MEQKDDCTALSTSSPYIADDVHDWLSAHLHQYVATRTIQNALPPADVHRIIKSAVQVEIGDARTYSIAFQILLRKENVNSLCCIETLTDMLSTISLAVKRKRSPIPPTIDRLIGQLHLTLERVKELKGRFGLSILSSLIRLRPRAYPDTVRLVSRRLEASAGLFTAQDTVFALRAISLLSNVSNVFAVRVISQTLVLAPKLTPADLGNVCKQLTAIRQSRSTHHIVTATGGKEVRRLLPVLLKRAEELLGSFSLRDARCVLLCFECFDLRHSVVFSQLTPLVSSDSR
jgi:hypothetical protein